MCLMDWRIGKHIKWSMLFTGEASYNVNSNPLRVGLIVAHDTTNPVFGTDAVIITLRPINLPIYIRQLDLFPLMITLATDGQWIQEQLGIQQGADTASLTVWEATLPEEWLVAGFDEFKSRLR